MDLSGLVLSKGVIISQIAVRGLRALQASSEGAARNLDKGTVVLDDAATDDYLCHLLLEEFAPQRGATIYGSRGDYSGAEDGTFFGFCMLCAWANGSGHRAHHNLY